MKWTYRLRKVCTSYTITLPPEVRALDWKDGDEMFVEIDETEKKVIIWKKE